MPPRQRGGGAGRRPSGKAPRRVADPAHDRRRGAVDRRAAADRRLRARPGAGRSIVDNFDKQLEYVLNAMIAASEIGPDGEVRFTRPPADQRFLEPYSGALFPDQRARARTPFRRARCGTGGCGRHRPQRRQAHNSNDISIRRTSRCASSSATRSCPDRRSAGASRWPSRATRSTSRSASCARRCSELRRARRRPARARRAAGLLRPVAAAPGAARGRRDPLGQPDPHQRGFPARDRPLVDEINELLAHSEAQAEEARRHAGNLAHALKTPLTVITNAATAHAPDLPTP
jgi:hypothetical protein